MLNINFGDGVIVSKPRLEKLVIARQRAAVATAFLLPWTTSGFEIALGLFLVLAIPTIMQRDLFAAFHNPAGFTPVLLFLLMLSGMLWSVNPLGPGGLSHYLKLLLIPILMGTAFTLEGALQVGYGYLAGCILVLMLSFLSFYLDLPWRHYAPGVPFKENAVQSTNFALCAFGLGIGALRAWKKGERRLSTAMALLALAFFINIFVIFISKTGALITIALMGRLLGYIGGWKRALLVAIAAIIIALGTIHFSSEAQRRLAEVVTDINAEIPADRPGEVSKATISTASRIDFWTKAVEFIKEAPVFGHGTGSTRSLYQSLEASRPSPYGSAVPDPHNQFLAIAIQVGLFGGLLLLTMWTSHAIIFRGGHNVVCVFGQAVVLQNIIGSVFNSHLSAVTEGTLYCFAVGLLAGLVVRSKANHARDEGHLV